MFHPGIRLGSLEITPVTQTRGLCQAATLKAAPPALTPASVFRAQCHASVCPRHYHWRFLVRGASAYSAAAASDAAVERRSLGSRWQPLYE